MIIKRALLSVWNKDGIVELGKFLSQKGVEILSTGGTQKALEEVVYSVETAKNGGDAIDHGEFKKTSNIIQSRTTQKEVAAIRKNFKRWNGDDLH